MDSTEFTLLPDGIYEFTTYMDEKIMGIPHVFTIADRIHYFVIPESSLHYYHELECSVEEKISMGLLIPLNIDIIDEHKKIK